MLNYSIFAASKRIQAAAKNAPPLKKGDKGYGVTLLQGSLIDLGYKLPLSTNKQGGPDGIYGAETKGVVWKFQEDKKLKSDGVAGRNTIVKIDTLMVAKISKIPKPHPKPKFPKPVLPKSRDYKIGVNDPSIISDRGSGVWNSVNTTAIAFAQKLAVLQVLPAAAIYIGFDAARHLRHYFSNLGTDLTINLVGMVNEVPSAKAFYELEINQAKIFVEQLPLGTHNITSTRTQGGYNEKYESKNWFYAVGGYAVWGKGKATVSNGIAGREYKLDFEYKFFDRYNWDKGKEVEIKIPLKDEEIVITDEFMGDFHRQGLAREYKEVGSFRKTINWKHGELISSEQIKPGSR